MILGGTPSAPALSLARAAAVFTRLDGVRIAKGVPASSTGKSRARQGAGPPDGHGFRLEAISLFEEGT